MAYDGFISYSHAADDRLAPALQRGLQQLAKPWNRRRALRIFRDETGLSTNPHLWSAIEGALDESEWFVLLASTDAATSEWVNKEISHWLAAKSIDHLLPVLTEGTWEWDATTRDFTPESSAVPDALRGALRDEPRHLDLRWARSETDLDLRNTRFRSAVADLAAPMHGVAKDELEGEDIRQHRRARRLARAGVSSLAVLVVVAVVFGAFAVVQRNRARTATAEAVVQRNRANTNANRANANADRAEHELLVSESEALLGSDRQLATLLAIEADRRKPGADTRDALMNAVLAEPLLQRTFADTSSVDMAALVGHRVVILNANRGTTLNPDVLQVWDWQTGLRETWHDAPLGDATNGPLDMQTTADGLVLAVSFRDGTIQLYSGRTLEPQGPPFPSGFGKFRTVSPPIWLSKNGQTLAVSCAPATEPPCPSIHLFSRVGNRFVPVPPLGGNHRRVSTAGLSGDGSVIATASPTPTGNDIVISDVRSGRPLFSFATVPATSIALDWTHRRVVVAPPSGGAGDAVWYDLNTPDPIPHIINVGSTVGVGYASLAYDSTDSRLGINTSNGTGIFDAATLTPIANVPVLPTNSQGPFVFLDAAQVVTAPYNGGPVSLWDLNETSVLATRTAAQFDKGVYPLTPTRFEGTSTLGNVRSVTVLGRDYRPLGASIPIEQDLDRLPADVQSVIRVPLPAVACADARSGRIATVSAATGDIIVRAGTPPFRTLTRAAAVATRLADPLACTWSPDGRQIAIGNYPQNGQAASVATYDVASKTLQFVKTLPGQVAIATLFYSADSKTLWVGGANNNANGVYQLTELDHKPKITAQFPGTQTIAIGTDSDRRRLVVTNPTTVRVYDAHTLEPLTQAIIVGDNIYALWSAPDGHTAVVESPQGWRLIDLDAQQPIGPWNPNPFPSAALIGADSNTVYTTAPNGGGGEIWDVSPTNLRAAACGLAGRNVTKQEWQKYLPWAGPPRATCPQYPSS